MSDHLDAQSDSAPLSRRPLELAGRAVLLATDGSPSAAAAARVAYALAEAHHAIVHVVNVVDSRSAPIPPPIDIAIAMGDAIGGSELHREQERAVRDELSGTLDATIDWPVRIMLGTPSSAIVQDANRLGAALIIVGLRRHGRLDRVVHDETALNVMRVAGCPVLGVVAELQDLPGRILAAVDFSEGSLSALRAGRAVAGHHPVLVLAYVNPMNGFLADEGEATIHDLGVQAGFVKLSHELGDADVAFDHVVLHTAPPQSPAQALLEYADEIGSDLITAGSVQHSRIDRWMVGSVSGELVRNGRRSVLIVPPRRGL
ncbi:MAG TPA: universal stress protein [Gemmatimonadaceae bacterium]|nr:universal stress protein [Gemmatimonadaceae bacterium]